MPPILRRLSAIAVLLLSLAIVAVLTLRALGVPIALGPEPSPTASAAEPSAGATPPASAPASVDPLAVFAEIEADVEDLRDLPPADIGPPDIITRAEAAAELEEILDEAWTEEELARDNLVLRALGLLTGEQDLRQLTQELYAAQVLGYYDFTEKRMVVVSDTGLTAEARLTYAHEYTHALQDAAFDIGADREESDLADDDAALARVALEEGDATAVMFEWALDGNLTPEELLGIGAQPLPDMTGIPEWMVQQLTLPYTAGFEFVSQLQLSGGWSAVDAAYHEPPASTEQIIHPDKYLDAEAPAEVEGVDVSAALGDGWEEVESTTIGEAMLSIWLDHLGVRPGDASEAAAGWGGDRLRVATGPGGAWALAWTITFDSPAHADEFVEADADITGAPMVRDLAQVSDTEVVVLHASSASLLEALAAAIG
ncbi:MAG TPA: hypothetical protein VFH63_04845 [candidate division Zixibacteria bacterium]|nr:hypothetical protein [candidate division Zixibacteria bacterium]